MHVIIMHARTVETIITKRKTMYANNNILDYRFRVYLHINNKINVKRFQQDVMPAACRGSVMDWSIWRSIILYKARGIVYIFYETAHPLYGHHAVIFMIDVLLPRT